jgi:hypothetical protein
LEVTQPLALVVKALSLLHLISTAYMYLYKCIIYIYIYIYWLPDTIIDTKGKQKSLEAWNLNPCEWSMDATQSFEEWYLASTWWWWWWWRRISSWWRTFVMNRNINPWRWRWWLCPSRHPLQLVIIRDFIWWNHIRGRPRRSFPCRGFACVTDMRW